METIGLPHRIILVESVFPIRIICIWDSVDSHVNCNCKCKRVACNNLYQHFRNTNLKWRKKQKNRKISIANGERSRTRTISFMCVSVWEFVRWFANGCDHEKSMQPLHSQASNFTCVLRGLITVCHIVTWMGSTRLWHWLCAHTSQIRFVSI